MSAALLVSDVNGLSVVVDITATAVYSDADCTSEVSMPDTITADATYFLPQAGTYAVSITVGGQTHHVTSVDLANGSTAEVHASRRHTSAEFEAAEVTAALAATAAALAALDARVTALETP